MAKKRINKIIYNAHLWLGLSTGLIVFVVSLSGSVYAFRDEIYGVTHSDVIYLKDEDINEETLPLGQLWTIAQEAAGSDIKLNHLYSFNDKHKSWYFRAYKADDSKWNYFDELVYDQLIYVNPYSGKILLLEDFKYEFFNLVKMFHFGLFLSVDISKQVIGWSIFLFCFSICTGIFLWIKSRNPFRKKISVNWKAKWRRVNFDLHNVVGVYGGVFAFIFGLTGLVIAFRWFMSLVYVLVNFSVTPPAVLEASSPEVGFEKEMSVIDIIKKEVDQNYPDAPRFIYNLPHHDEEHQEPCEVYILNREDVFYDGSLAMYHWETGQMLSSKSFESLSRGEKLLYMNYDIHIGAVLGVWGKILAFLGSLLCAALPVTGFLIWYGRKTKDKRVLLDGNKLGIEIPKRI